jgi:hypothetical protein
MGLDMYAYSADGAPQQPVDFESPDEGRQELAYWRKHPDLHGWMERLYRAKGGTDEQFNCVNVQITEEDLLQLEADVKNRRLVPTSGFFFGRSGPEDMQDDLAFIEKARQALSEGKTVYYTSWW